MPFRPLADPYDTPLNPDEETAFQVWKQQNAPGDSGVDYDLRGAFKAGLSRKAPTDHLPDTFKKPNHPTFSNESIYAKDAPDRAGHWEGQTFIPAAAVLPTQTAPSSFRALPVVPREPAPRRVANPGTLLGGAGAAIERPGIPPWLETVEGLAAPAVGLGAATLAAPAAGLAGVVTGGGPLVAGPIEAGAFTAGTMAAERGMRAGNKALGYRVPPKPSAAESALEAGATAVAYPVGEFIPDLLKQGAARLTGVTARRAARAAAAEGMTDKLNTRLWNLHGDVENVARQVEGVHGEAVARGETAIREGARRASEKSVTDLTAGVPGISDTAQTTVSRDLSAAALQRDLTVGTLEKLYGRTQGAFGKEYDALVQPFLKDEVPPDVVSSLSQAVQGIQGDQRAFESPPPALRAVLDRMGKWGGETDVGALTTGKAVNAQEAEALRAALAAAGGAEPAEPVTFADLQRARGDLRKFFTSDNAPARYASRSADRSILDAYDAAGLPRDPELNRRYKLWRQRWDGPAVRKLYRSETPEEIRSLVTGDMIEPLMGQAQPEDRAAVRDVVARVIRSERNLTPAQLTQRFSPTILRDYFGKGADDVARWAAVDARTADVAQLLQTDAGLRQQFLAHADRAFNESITKGSTRIRKLAVNTLKALGEPAKPLLQQVRRMSPEAATRFYLDEMRSPRFAESLIRAAKEGLPLPAVWRSRHGLAFGVGLAGYELASRSEITSPWAMFSLMVGTGMLARGAVQRATIQLLEREGFAAGARILDGTMRAGVRGAAVKRLGQQLGKVFAADILRGAVQPDDQQ